ncbi:aminoglycoside phosphotransferase [Actinokineospora auranticolor]|uniref:Maltokinase n=1 Tax=Actinokineospora auranticolor TaxID=155976 RepID=A0A2S6GJL2_9PSEU|nr:aminoglycoside phosphotransferase [Actinokineospora auranticolor]PPK65424.1 maltokinase [Actinokineospora auranticolor]
MSLTAVDLVPALLPRVARALPAWLPQRRWFAGKGAPLVAVELTAAARFADQASKSFGVLAVAEVRYAGGKATERYQLPLGFSPTPPEGEPVIAWLDGLAAYDATGDHELTSELLRLIGRDHDLGEVRFTAEPGGELAFAHRNGMRSRRMTAEQSNTSIVFGDRFILKLFRRLSDGVNPDLDVHRALGRAESRHVAPLLGAIEGPGVTFGVLHSFVADAVDGWRLAVTEACQVARGEDVSRFLDEARGIGAAVAAVHRDLGQHYGTAPLDLAAVRRRLLATLDSAVPVVPALTCYADRLRELFDGLDAPAATAQRIHGDLHLGQVLRTPARWLLIDFEGEPSHPIPVRTAAQSPLRDVAGMLRSFDYAAEHELQFGVAEHFHEHACARVRQWAADARDEFCAGYASGSGVDPRAHGDLLRAFELEKMLYEAEYETRNRPDWVRIPLRTLRPTLGE